MFLNQTEVRCHYLTLDDQITDILNSMHYSVVNAPQFTLTCCSSAIPKMTILQSIVLIPEAQSTKKNKSFADIMIEDPVRDDDDVFKYPLIIKIIFTNCR